jgi:hypothetical protein
MVLPAMSFPEFFLKSCGRKIAKPLDTMVSRVFEQDRCNMGQVRRGTSTSRVCSCPRRTFLRNTAAVMISAFSRHGPVAANSPRQGTTVFGHRLPDGRVCAGKKWRHVAAITGPRHGPNSWFNSFPAKERRLWPPASGWVRQRRQER